MERTRPTIELEERVKTYSDEGLSCRAIVKKLKEKNIILSKTAVNAILNNEGKRRSAKFNGSIFKVKRQRPKRTAELVRKVKEACAQENPPSQREMARKHQVALGTINKIIHKDCKLETRRKTKVHRLSAAHEKNRKKNCRKLYENVLAGGKCEYVVTIDEAWFYLNDCDGQRSICYTKKGSNMVENWVKEKKEKFSKGFMVVGALSGRGRLPLRKVPSKVKVNSRYYIDSVLAPLIDQDLPALYPGEMHKVVIHHDKASSHTSRETQQYLQQKSLEVGISWLANEDIPVKAPDASPLDFYGFGFLKQKLSRRRPKTVEGLWKVLNEVWSTVSLQDIKKVYDSWKRRCRMVTKMHGKHVEQTKAIHRRRVHV